MTTTKKTKLELTWPGKEDRPRLEPRILIEDPAKSYLAASKGEGDLFDNMLIKGDNLLALKALEADYAGKVKCVFIDPPYNTGSAFAHYDDGLEHSLWLSLMRDRLECIYRLLADDGSLWVTLDDGEAHYFKVMCDEVFGRSNFIANFIWQKSYGGGSKARWFVGLHEHLMCYAKDLSAFPDMWLPPDPDATQKYYKYTDDKFADRGPYRLQPLATTSMADRPNLKYPIPLPGGGEVWPEKQWQWSRERVLTALGNDELVFTTKSGKTTVSYKQYLKGADGEERGRKPVSIITGHYTQHGTTESVALFGQANKFSFPKPEGLIEIVLEACTSPGDLVLDSFAGSGTTGAVAHKMGRRWIMVEIGDHADTHIVPRLQKVINGTDQGGISKAVEWKGGGGFRYYTLAPSLLSKDAWGNWVVDKQYNPEMLAEALCKHLGFAYAPSQDESEWWRHGQSSESDFLYVTTQSLTHDALKRLSDAVGPERSLVVCARAFAGSTDAFPNLTAVKIPTAILNRCEWGRDDYSLNIAALPATAEQEPEVDAPDMGPLFAQGGADDE